MHDPHWGFPKQTVGRGTVITVWYGSLPGSSGCYNRPGWPQWMQSHRKICIIAASDIALLIQIHAMHCCCRGGGWGRSTLSQHRARQGVAWGTSSHPITSSSRQRFPAEVSAVWTCSAAKLCFLPFLWLTPQLMIKACSYGF